MAKVKYIKLSDTLEMLQKLDTAGHNSSPQWSFSSEGVHHETILSLLRKCLSSR